MHNNQQGIIIYCDGTYQNTDKSCQLHSGVRYPTGVLKIGRLFEDPNSERNTKVMVDELSIWNQQLTQTEVQAVVQLVENPSGQ